MDKKEVLDWLDELFGDLRTTVPEALIDEHWCEKRRALQIAMNVLKGVDEDTILENL